MSHTPDDIDAPDRLDSLADAVAAAAADEPTITDTVVTDEEARIAFCEDSDRDDVRTALPTLDVVGVNDDGRLVRLSFDPVRLAHNRLRVDPDAPVHFVATCDVVAASS